MRCAVFGCTNNNNKNSRIRDTSIRFFTFPKDDDIEKEWRKACGRIEDFINTKTARICSVHFQQSDYVRNLKYELLGYDPIPWYAQKLKLTAVPTLHLPKGVDGHSEISEKMDDIKVEIVDVTHLNDNKNTDPLNDWNCSNYTIGEISQLNDKTTEIPADAVISEIIPLDDDAILIATDNTTYERDTVIKETVLTNAYTVFSEKDSLDDETAEMNIDNIITLNEETVLTDTNNQSSEITLNKETGLMDTKNRVSKIRLNEKTGLIDTDNEVSEITLNEETGLTDTDNMSEFEDCDSMDNEESPILTTPTTPAEDCPRTKETNSKCSGYSEIIQFTNISELDEQSKEICLVIIDNLNDCDVPKYTTHIQQAACLTGVSYPVLLQVVEEHWERLEQRVVNIEQAIKRMIQLREASLVKTIFQIEQEFSKAETPSFDLYYSKLSDFKDIITSKRQLWHWLELLKVGFDDTLDLTVEDDLQEYCPLVRRIKSEEPKLDVTDSDNHEINEDTKTSLDVLNSRTDIQRAPTEVQQLLNGTNTCIKDEPPDLPEYVVLENMNTGECQKKKLNYSSAKLPEYVVLEGCQKEKLDSTFLSLIKDINCQSVAKHKKTSTLENVHKKMKLSDKEISKENVLKSLRKLNNNFQMGNEETQRKSSVDPLIVSSLTELENRFWSIKLKPTLNEFYKELTKIKEMSDFSFSRETVARWLNDLDIKYYKDVPSIDYFVNKFRTMGIMYPRNLVMEWLKALNIAFKEKYELKSSNTTTVPVDEIKSLISHFTEEYYTPTAQMEIDPVSLKVITNFEYNFHLMGKIPTLDCFYEGFISVVGTICSKGTFKNWLQKLNIKYEETKNLVYKEHIDYEPTIDYFVKKFEYMNMKYSKQVISKWLKQLKINFQEEQMNPLDPSADNSPTNPSDINCLLKLLILFNKQFYMPEPATTEQDVGLKELITGIEYHFTQRSAIPTFDFIYFKVCRHYKDTTKEVLIDLLNKMNVRYKKTKAMNVTESPKRELNTPTSLCNQDIPEPSTLHPDVPIPFSNKSENNKYFIPTLDYFYGQFTKKAGRICSKLTLKKWLNAIQIFYYPTKLHYNNYTIPEISLNKNIITMLLKIEGEYQLSLDEILKYVVMKIKNQKDIQSLQLIYQYIQSFKLLRKESYYSKAMLRDWLNSKQLRYSDGTNLEKEGNEKKEGVFVPTLEYFLSNLEKGTGRTYSKYQVATWLASAEIEFQMDEQNLLTTTSNKFDKPTKEIYDLLIKLEREIRLEYLKFQLKEIDWTLSATLRKPNYMHLHQIIENSNFFNYVQNPEDKEIIYKKWLKKIGISFIDNNKEHFDAFNINVPHSAESNITNKPSIPSNKCNVPFEKLYNLQSTSKNCSDTQQINITNTSNNLNEPVPFQQFYTLPTTSTNCSDTQQRSITNTSISPSSNYNERLDNLPSTSINCSHTQQTSITNTSINHNVSSTLKNCSDTQQRSITTSINPSNNCNETVQLEILHNLSTSKKCSDTQQRSISNTLINPSDNYDTVSLEKLYNLRSTSRNCSNIQQDNIVSYHIRFSTDNTKKSTNAVEKSSEQGNAPGSGQIKYVKLEDPIVIPNTVFPHIKMPDNSRPIQLPQGYKLVKLTDLPRMQLPQINEFTKSNLHENTNVPKMVNRSDLEIVSYTKSKHASSQPRNSNLNNSSKVSNMNYERSSSFSGTLVPYITPDSEHLQVDNFIVGNPIDKEVTGSSSAQIVDNLNGSVRSVISTFSPDIMQLQSIIANIPVSNEQIRTGFNVGIKETNSKNNESTSNTPEIIGSSSPQMVDNLNGSVRSVISTFSPDIIQLQSIIANIPVSNEQINVEIKETNSKNNESTRNTPEVITNVNVSQITENQNIIQPIITSSKDIIEIDDEREEPNTSTRKDNTNFEEENRTASPKHNKIDVIEIDDDPDETEIPKKKFKKNSTKLNTTKKIKKIKKCGNQTPTKSNREAQTLTTKNKPTPQVKVQKGNKVISKKSNQEAQTSTAIKTPTSQPIEVIELEDDSNDTPPSVNENIRKSNKRPQTELNLPPCSNRVLMAFSDVEYEFHAKNKVPTLDEFYIKLLELCGTAYSKNVIRSWLKNIGIRFIDDRR